MLVLIVVAAAAMNRLAPMPTAKFLRDISRSVAGLEAKTLDSEGKTFPYLVGGNGAPLILVHGFTANKDTWSAVARYLTPHYTIYAPDLPGFGDASRDPNGDYSYEAQVANLHAFIKGLGLKSVDLGGSSMGEGVAALYAATYPNEVSTLWLLDAAGTREAIDSPLIKNYLATGEFPLLVKTPEQQVKKFEMIFGKPKFIPYSVEYAFWGNTKNDFYFHRKILKQLTSSQSIFEERYKSLQTPSLIVTGELDQIVPPAAAQTWEKCLLRAKLKSCQELGMFQWSKTLKPPQPSIWHSGQPLKKRNRAIEFTA